MGELRAWEGEFRTQSLKETTAGRNLDPSSAGHGKKMPSLKVDTRFQEKTATRGPCSPPRTASSQSLVRSPGRGTRRKPGLASWLKRLKLEGEPATRQGTRQWASAQWLSRETRLIRRGLPPPPDRFCFAACVHVLQNACRGSSLEQTRTCANCPSTLNLPSLFQYRHPDPSKIT